MRLIVLGLLLCACDTAQRPRPDAPSAATEVELRSNADGRPIAAQDAGLDSAGAAQRLAEIQAIADTAMTEPLGAPALLRAGLLKLHLFPVDIMGDAAAGRPQDFFHNEIAGGWLYNGADFDTLLARFPTSVLADDARFAKLFLVPGGECEGRTDCRLHFVLDRPMEFLTTDPNSPLASTVLARINQGLREALADVPDMRTQTETFDPAAVRGLLAAYDSLARRLPSPLRDSATTLLDSILVRLGTP